MNALKPVYQKQHVNDLFSEMAATYGIMNLITSFGFTHLWRKICVAKANIQENHVVYDLLTGMGECLPPIRKRLISGKLRALDFCPTMCEKAKDTARRLGLDEQTILCEDVFFNSVPDNIADRIVCSFGLKTFSREQSAAFAKEIFRILKPGSRFSAVEISVPKTKWLTTLYLFYIGKIIPLLGKLFLGNPQNYRELGLYTQAFESCERTATDFKQAGLTVRTYSLFFGCATGIVAEKAKS